MFCTPPISLPGLDPCVGIFPVRRLQGGTWIYLRRFGVYSGEQKGRALKHCISYLSCRRFYEGAQSQAH
ncbi:hypothetical protein VN97_g7215 [Penicillium thymicola]|uniref:Uncharacterized protein n=1 Tax=Penicillium thymicola TaxID=293382 RepID=A0AAI9X6Q9_PENTH|nr:hypothetical protein VN97_g7215 [Penicillium thymicola]